MNCSLPLCPPTPAQPTPLLRLQPSLRRARSIVVASAPLGRCLSLVCARRRCRARHRQRRQERACVRAQAYLEALEGGLAARRLVLHHGADGAPHHARGGTEVEGTKVGVGVLPLLEDGHEQQLVADEAAAARFAPASVPCATHRAWMGGSARQGSTSPNAQRPGRTTGGRPHLPEMFTSSQRTSTTRCPAMSSLAMMEQRRPRRCPRQSTTTVFSNIMENCSPTHGTHHTTRTQTYNHHRHRQRLPLHTPTTPLRRLLRRRAAPARV